jgi:hypothetical protein
MKRGCDDTGSKCLFYHSIKKKQYSHKVILGFNGGGYKDYDRTGCDNVKPFSLVDTELNTIVAR